ncbi:MAG TPA: sigma-70 family RNA polymerase sigma factor [Myxococcales bacterium]|jgi:RNA polymerase sigma-70 factor (ECF subfamily)|nr:sigma-70 family RNA polymerase sigma factor [Myxococcales bacterium]
MTAALARIEEDSDVAQMIERARQEHPHLTVDADAFAAHLAACARSAGSWALKAEDVYLAFACGHGDRRALALIEERYLAQVDQFVRHLRRQPSFVDEVRQQLRERILIGSGTRRAPKILDYTGRGSLTAWFRVTAIRQALDLMARERGPGAAVELPEDDQLAAAVDPELVAMRQRYLPQFREAFRAALGSLDARERNLLRFYLVDGLNIERIGQIFGKSRATVGRMVVDCRKKLLDETRRHLGVLTGASEGDVRSLIRLLRSQLDVSIRGFLLRDVQ